MSATLWRALYAEAAVTLGSDTDARRIVERASGRNGAEFHLALDEPVPARAVPFFESMVCRRAGGEPLQYVIGAWGFRGLDLLVDQRVLIPRPETETVVEVALDQLRDRGNGPCRVVDLGTGSGAIALSIAQEVPRAEVWATDSSEDALAVARANLAGLGRPATRVRMLRGDWYDALPPQLAGTIDLVVSNPPYVADGEELSEDVAAWEPAGALRAGPTGLESVAAVIRDAPRWLASTGALVVELAPEQADAALAMAGAAGFAKADVRPDLAGRPRALVAWR